MSNSNTSFPSLNLILGLTERSDGTVATYSGGAKNTTERFLFNSV